MSQLTQGNIIREVAVSVASADFEDKQGFFIRATTGGVITYVPLNNQDNEPITKTIEASVIFNDPVMARKIIAEVETSPATSYASGIHVGYGQ
jgi:hypothetical protein